MAILPQQQFKDRSLTIMTTSEMIKAIRNKSAEMKAMENEKAQRIFFKNMEYIDKAKELIKEHGRDIMRVVNELQDNGFYLITKREMENGIHSSKWVTDGIRHNVGFVTTTPKHYYNGELNIIGFGIQCGGCDGNIDLTFDFDGNMVEHGQIFSDGRMITLYNFVDGFEDFVNGFYEYVERTYLAYI